MSITPLHRIAALLRFGMNAERPRLGSWYCGKTHFVSPEFGLKANHLLISQLRPQLISWANKHDAQLDNEWLFESLSLTSAKAWLAKETLNLCTACSVEWSASYNSDLRIENGRWELSPLARSLGAASAGINKNSHLWRLCEFCTPRMDLADHKQGRVGQIWKHGWS